MKTILAFIWISFLCPPLFAQQEDKTVLETNSSIDYKQHVFKLNLTSLAFRNISLQYEYILKPKLSVALGLRYMPKGKLPFSSSIINTIDDEDEDAEDIRGFIRDSRVGGFAVTPEFRYYLGRRRGKGVYLASFVRYERFDFTSNYLINNDDGSSNNVAFKGKNSSIGGGIMLGWQFNIGDYVTLDLWLLGSYYKYNNLSFSADNLNLSDEDVATLKKDLDDTEVLWFDLKNTVEKNHVNVSAKGSFAGIRSLGLCVGFRL